MTDGGGNVIDVSDGGWRVTDGGWGPTDNGLTVSKATQKKEEKTAGVPGDRTRLPCHSSWDPSFAWDYDEASAHLSFVGGGLTPEKPLKKPRLERCPWTTVGIAHGGPRKRMRGAVGQ